VNGKGADRDATNANAPGTRAKKVRVGFTFSQVLIIESLPAGEVRTGGVLAETLRPIIDEHSPEIAVELLVVDGSEKFQNVLIALGKAAPTGHRPVLHVECHGSQAHGLVFADGSVLSWDAFGNLLTDLNVATQFNLLSVVSACFGAHLLGQFSPVRPAPAWCIIAPTEEVFSSELMAGFRQFYAELFATSDAGKATDTILRTTLSSGTWFAKLAEDWYEDVVVQFIEKQCTHDAMHRWAKSAHRKAKRRGLEMNLKDTRRGLVDQVNAGVSSKYFDRFFCVDRLPNNVVRFETARTRVVEHVERLRATGRYAL
jgi:hypothetical protein